MILYYCLSIYLVFSLVCIQKIRIRLGRVPSANSRRDSECQGGRLIICWPTWAAATQIDFQRINVRPALIIVFSVLI